MTDNSTKPALFDYKACLQQHWIVALGILALAIPSVLSLSQTLWQGEEQGHGPILLAIVLWLFWRVANEVHSALAKPNTIAGFVLVLCSAFIYIIGRSQEIYAFEIGAFIPLIIGIILALHGFATVKKYWFPLLFLAFLIPLPAFITDWLTSGLKNHISYWAEVILYELGYPVSRSGVILYVGQYQLLVADACSGMNSLFSLIAVGVLYVYLNGDIFEKRSLLLLVSIVPIAFIANVIRVLTLILVTYYYGDEAGQGFIHSFAGIAVFAISLALLYIFDNVLRKVWKS